MSTVAYYISSQARQCVEQECTHRSSTLCSCLFKIWRSKSMQAIDKNFNTAKIMCCPKSGCLGRSNMSLWTVQQKPSGSCTDRRIASLQTKVTSFGKSIRSFETSHKRRCTHGRWTLHCLGQAQSAGIILRVNALRSSAPIKTSALCRNLQKIVPRLGAGQHWPKR